MIEFVFHTDTGSEEADGSNDQPLFSALYRLHQLGHQPPLQYIALDPAQTQPLSTGLYDTHFAAAMVQSTAIKALEPSMLCPLFGLVLTHAPQVQHSKVIWLRMTKSQLLQKSLAICSLRGN